MFERKNEQAPQWLMVLDYMRSVPDHHVATWEELAGIADCPVASVSSLVGIVNAKAVDEGLRLVAVRGHGYRRATPGEALIESTVVRAKRFGRQAKRAKAAADAARNHPQATPLERAQADQAGLHWSEMVVLGRRQSKRLRRSIPELPLRVRSSSEL